MLYIPSLLFQCFHSFGMACSTEQLFFFFISVDGNNVIFVVFAVIEVVTIILRGPLLDLIRVFKVPDKAYAIDEGRIYAGSLVSSNQSSLGMILNSPTHDIEQDQMHTSSLTSAIACDKTRSSYRPKYRTLIFPSRLMLVIWAILKIPSLADGRI